jgi:hypothetical protein
MTAVDARAQTTPFPLSYWHFQALPLPQAKHSRQPRTPSLFSKQPANPPITVPRLRPRQLQHPLHQQRLVGTWLGRESLSAPRLIDYRACPSLGDAELRSKLDDRRSLPGRPYQFPSERCFSIWMSNAWSATSCFSRRFSSSKSFSLLASSHFIPPYWARQRSSVDSLTSRA